MSASALGASQAIQFLPAGSMVDFAGTSAPAGWLMCDGRSLPTASYPDLFAALSYSYGGSGANFSLPDFRGRFARYLDNMGGTAANIDTGRIMGTAQSDAMQGHKHSISDNGHSHTVQSQSARAGAATGGGPGNTIDLGSGSTGSSFTNISVLSPTTDGTNGIPRTAVETRPVNIVCTKIIKF